MNLEIPKDNPFKFEHTYKVHRNTYILFEVLNNFSDGFNYDPIVKQKINELIFYLEDILFPIRDKDDNNLSYDLINEELFIKDTFQRFIPKNKKE